MKRRIFRSIMLVALVVLLASLILIVGVLHMYFEDRVTEELGQAISYIAHGVENEGISYLTKDMPGEDRITWVAADGTVLFENRKDAAVMENHADREEILQAMEKGYGTAVRLSNTLSERTIYYALRLQDDSILRLAATQHSVWVLVLRTLQPMLLVMILAVALAMWMAGRLSRQLVAPINAIDLEDSHEAPEYEELAPLLDRLHSQSRQIRRQMQDLRRRQEEFDTITGHMSEGLLLIDQNKSVLSYNAAALELLETEPPVEGSNVLEFSNHPLFCRCVEEVLSGHRSEVLLETDDKCRRIFANPVYRDGVLAGAVLIVLDVTEKERRETLRREFTANVSHELKTPLTGILGTAEIIQNGLVKPEDIPYFAGNIHREAQRLLDLVNDIIKISRLDEGEPAAQWETIDLRSVAETVQQQLETAAERKRVTMTLRGSSAFVRGVPQIVEEILYNLCDNAIAYNVPDGTVTVTIVNLADGARVIVEDTGVGISKEMQGRVFERFYRADKSHSGGGTGLGLSIVKHGAAYLGAQVTLESQVGKGSMFTLVFPPVEPHTES